MSHDEIDNIPAEEIVTYTHIFSVFCPQDEEPNRVQITAGGYIIKYLGKLTTRTEDLTK